MGQPKTGDTFCCECRHCGGRRTVSTGYRAIYAHDPAAPEDLFAENDCRCPKPVAVLKPVPCEYCSEVGKHWLGCEYIGLPEMPAEHPAIKATVH
jgi:hypothetical protein